MRAKFLIFIGLMIAAATAAQAAGNPAKGQQKAETCLGCHAIPGYRYSSTKSPVFHVPKVGGQHAAYIVSALQEYKNGNRDNPTMRAQANQLSTQDMEDIAAYFARAGK
ncbi:c-type cytochrome [Nitrococcus mobilis]|uniref:Cytochrome c, class I n=1 Tax=Nitrococcus mobilis Nb-231 TaxID=314278 RepID=A4BSN1_9GAMM|nr:cytochrome c [Nitrococcus mobilis]EAR21301.1 Cytochrome c, class I [Nitrococcus mobilis Nb-231]